VLQRQPELAPLLDASSSSAFDVIKMQNFSNCEQRRGVHIGVSGLEDFEPGDNKMGDFMSVSVMYLLSVNISSLRTNSHNWKLRHGN
jgi:hypothetical protein